MLFKFIHQLRSHTVKCLSEAYMHKNFTIFLIFLVATDAKENLGHNPKIFLSLNKAQTYGSDTCSMCKIKMSEKLKKQRQRKGKKIIVYT